jgi:hypothetical protein
MAGISPCAVPIKNAESLEEDTAGCLVMDSAFDTDRFVSDLLAVGKRFSKNPVLY